MNENVLDLKQKWGKDSEVKCGGEKRMNHKKRDLVMLPKSSKKIMFTSVPRIGGLDAILNTSQQMESNFTQTINNLLLRAKTHMHEEKACMHTQADLLQKVSDISVLFQRTP